jgi:ADP-heptose:LPS heptosyltransferase
MKILFVTSNRLGDAVLSTGLLDHLIATHPDARITVVCGPVAAELFDRMPNRVRTIILRKQPGGRHWLRLWAQTAATLWDLVVDIRGSALSWLVPTRRRAVYRRMTGRKTDQLAAILTLRPAPLPVAWISEADRAVAAVRLAGSRPIIALAPTANWSPKAWPAERFAAAFRTLADTLIPGALPAVMGGPGLAEAAMAAPLLTALPEAVDLVGTLTLPQVAACLERVALFIGNDSGLMHLAAAAGAPAIGLFGPTDAATYGPAGPRAVAVVGYGGAMTGISVEQVVAAAAALLGQPPTEASNALTVPSTSRPVVSS